MIEDILDYKYFSLVVGWVGGIILGLLTLKLLGGDIGDLGLGGFFLLGIGSLVGSTIGYFFISRSRHDS